MFFFAHNYSREAFEGQSLWYDKENNCVIAGRSMIMSGVKVAGNPAKIRRKGTVISERGQILIKGEKV